MSPAIRFWAPALLIAALAGAAVDQMLRPPSPSRRFRLVAAELPEGWQALPVTARIEGVTADRSGVEGCGEGHGGIGYAGTLGRFRVTWAELYIHGTPAGEQGWSVVDPELSTECPALPEPPGPHLHPDTLHEDAAQRVFVPASHGRPQAACRLEETPETGPAPVGDGTRRRVVGAVVGLALLLSAALRRQTREAA